MRFIKIILTVFLSLVALLSAVCLVAGAPADQPGSFYYIFFAVTGAGSLLCVYFLVKSIRKNNRDATPKNVSAQPSVIVHSPEAICSTSANISIFPPERNIDKSIYDGRQSPVESIANIISCENGEAISLDMVAQKTNMPPAAIGEYVSSMFFDVLCKVTAAHPILSEKQEKMIRELAAVCGATLSEDVENQLKKLATIREIASFKADPREFVRKSLLVE